MRLSPGVDLSTRRTVLDLVDPLDRAYRDRAALVGGLRGVGFRLLARAHARNQRRIRLDTEVVVVAGHDDALALGATWLPITVMPDKTPSHGVPDHDLVFAGTLSYPPNIGVLQRLHRLWPRVLARRPGTTMLVAGASPVAEDARSALPTVGP